MVVLPQIDPTQMDGIARFPEPERVSESDRALLARLTARQRELQRAAAELEGLVQEHFAAVYGLNPGDRIEDDGTIIRGPESTP